MKKYHIIVFGCQMNLSDAERLASVFEQAGYKETKNVDGADLVAVVMCSVRQTAVDRVHGLANKFEEIKSKNPKLKTVLTGCVLKKDRRIFEQKFDCVIDIKEIQKIPQILKIKKSKIAKDYLNIAPKYSSKFSANVPIMTGCNNFCSYCVVPYSRQREISRPAKEIIAEIKNLVSNGYKEIWLLGQNVNSYSDILKNVGMIDFAELLKMVNNIPGDFWIRFTSSHPKDFSDQFISAMKNCAKLPPYLNLPAQSGDDKILAKMNRPYTIAKYKNLVAKIKKSIPNICISTDIIVGFPGETKKQFNNTAKLMRQIKYDMAYINKYSPRPGTAAEKMEDNVPADEKKQREKVLTDILRKTALQNNQKLVGKKARVLIDSQKNGTLFGKTDTYKSIKIKYTPDSRQLAIKPGDFVEVKITKANGWSLEGQII